MSNALTFPFPDAPAPGAAVQVASGILWLRLPLPMALDHVNLYALDDGPGWTLVDTGINSRTSRTMMQALLDGPLAGKPVTRVILTHHHPDHVGLAGWLQDRGAELLATRTAWLYARMLTLDVQPSLTPQAREFLIRAGTPPALLAKREADRPFNFADVVHPLPTGFTRIAEGDVIRAGGRDWHIRLGHGHAPDHATLWSEDDTLIIGGDQFLPGISPNIGVYPTEPQADPLEDWLASCRAFVPHARDHHLVLPGHKLPFTGLPFRLRQMAENHEQALARLTGRLATPMTAAETFPALFKREIGEGDFGLALAEAVAHLNWLLRRGLVSRSLRADGAWLWQAGEE
ncbi:MBL fold metallo-hydrolase [Fuscibacter oryzae]|uniref:MBL fold metallo-hydrolase n=1 Tax=Fuscibacter oryzae TaxID=2803939 RepID=A0A8J7MN72_9RHOB|nr:MBL fold metallo-hydrolase [Fuscibacter oryzae]MBL4926763.1 MBL fold metallo-hydrolase [Fuscibacter oryzae]